MGVRSRLTRVIYRRVHCPATTADLLQDTFLRFWERPGLLRDVVDLAAYFMIARGDSETAKNNAITSAANSVESTADKAGSAIDGATNGK